MKGSPSQFPVLSGKPKGRLSPATSRLVPEPERQRRGSSRLQISDWDWTTKSDHKIQSYRNGNYYSCLLAYCSGIPTGGRYDQLLNLVPISQFSCFPQPVVLTWVNRRWTDHSKGSPGKPPASTRWPSHGSVPSSFKPVWGQQAWSSCLLNLLSFLWCWMVPVRVARGS